MARWTEALAERRKLVRLSTDPGGEGVASYWGKFRIKLLARDTHTRSRRRW